MSRPNGLKHWMSRFGTKKTRRDDVRAGIVLGVEAIPDGLASGILAGVNPLWGINAYFSGMLVGALTTGSVFMTVQATSAMSVIISEVPGLENSAPALTTLTLLTGIVMLLMGLAKLGSLVRFVPTAVLIGFTNAVAINIILGQLSDFTGYAGTGFNRLTRAFDTLIHPNLFLLPTLIAAACTIVLILLFEKTPLGSLGMVAAVILVSVAVYYLPFFQSVPTLSDSVEVSGWLPHLSLPDLSVVPQMIIPAISLAFVGLVQGAAISGSIPNPNGKYADASTDFRGQGLANIASGLVQGLPVGGSMSATALVRGAGAKSALANLTAAVVMLLTMLTAAPLIGFTAKPALAGLLVLVGVRTFKWSQIVLVWHTGKIAVSVFLVTFILTMAIPLQFAVLTGVALSMVLHVIQQSNRIKIRRWIFLENESAADKKTDVNNDELTSKRQVFPTETDPPSTFGTDETIVLVPYGSLFFASAAAFTEQLPVPKEHATGSFVILRLRGSDELGVTFVKMLNSYSAELKAHGATLMLAGVNENLYHQLEVTGTLAKLGTNNVFKEEPTVGASLQQALEATKNRNHNTN